MVYTVAMVYTVDMVYIVDMVDNVDMVDTVDAVYYSNCCTLLKHQHVSLYLLLGKVRSLL